MEDLESKLRRSSCFGQQQIFREFLSYASMVCDPQEVYSYMEENKIGIDQPQFWNAKLTLCMKKGEYLQFVDLMKKIRANRSLLGHPKYWLIEQTEKQLEKLLELNLRRKAKGRRSARQYQILNFSNFQKQTRRFGRLQVYVDPDCRRAYRLEDLAVFTNQRLKEQCQLQKNFFMRENQDKPLSFLGRKDEYFMKLSQSLFHSTHKQDIQKPQSPHRQSLKPRNSCLCKTPEFKKAESKKKSLRRQSSVEILKKIGGRKSHLFVNDDIIDPEQQSSEKQKPRMSDKKEQRYDRSYLKDLNVSGFSFRRSSKYSDISSQTESQHRNNAFLQGSQEQSRAEDGNELEKVIKQIQLQRNESQTISEIDSNKQNAAENYENYVSQDRRKTRHLFGTIHKHLSQSQELSQSSFNEDSGAILYQQFIDNITQDPFYSQGSRQRIKEDLLPQVYISDRKKGRISRISEERSYSYSETRLKSHSHEKR